MGTYLSTPVTEKNQESGDSLNCKATPLSWGVVDMQGWRKSMEDAHMAQTDVDISSGCDAKVFGVFDGHGGPEVARFCSLYLISVLTQQPTWRETMNGGSSVNHHEPDDSKDTDIGKALVSTFHALDRMIDDPHRRDELIRLRAIKPAPGARKDADCIPPESGTVVAETQSPSLQIRETGGSLIINKEEHVDSPMENQTNAQQTPNNETANDDEMMVTNDLTPATETKERSQVEGDGDLDMEDSDSDEAVGKEEASKMDQDLMIEEEEEEKNVEVNVPGGAGTAGKVSVMLQRLLNMNVTGPSGQAVLSLGSVNKNLETDGSVGTGKAGNQSTRLPFRPSLVQNGRMICNLPDHPVHAGATAIVAVIVGRTLTVANAGDSRAVVCRNGTAIPLSIDHKPTQEREMNRISRAGGFVNAFGRVNGNLNLSRSIGDLKYKQVPGITPPEQMITAEPDILQYELESSDEFLILGCDGIWDCLTNEKAVEYVRTRINDRTPVEIGRDMLDEIISVDPLSTQGIGGDNMTIMIVDLQPLSRSYRKAADASPVED